MTELENIKKCIEEELKETFPCIHDDDCQYHKKCVEYYHKNYKTVSRAALERAANEIYEMWHCTTPDHPNPVDFIHDFMDKYGSKELKEKMEKELSEKYE